MNVDENGILQPLGVYVLSDSRYELLPGTRDYTEEIPGRAGEIDFGCDLRSRILELHCAVETTDAPAKMRELASYLNPLLGTQTLTFADEPGKVYNVRFSGTVDVRRYPTWMEFTISFKMYNPYIIGDTQNSLTGSGIAINNGTVATPFTLTIQGSVTNPSVIVGGYTMAYTGTIAVGSALVIDTEKMTAVLDGSNVLPNYNGVFPLLQPGNNDVTAAAEGTTIIRWYNRWI